MKVDALNSSLATLRAELSQEGMSKGKGAQRPSPKSEDAAPAPDPDSLPTSGDPGTPAERAAALGFRSPSTANAFSRLEQRVLDNLEGEARAEAEQLLQEISQMAQSLSAEDSRPFGRSVEHALKQLFNAASTRFTVLPPAPDSPAPNDPAPVPTVSADPVEPVAEEEVSLDILV